MYWTVPAFVALLTGCGGEKPVALGVAASTRVAVDAALDGAPLGSVQRTSAASSLLVRQTEQGIGYDLLLLAHPQWADALGDRVIDRVDLLGNEVVLVAEHTGPTVDDLVAVDCLAVGDPSHVPTGMYAKAALERADAWLLVEDRLRPTRDAPAAVWAVRNGVCAVGAVYRTDAMGTGLQVGEVLVGEQPVRYPLVLLSERGRPLFELLRSDGLWPAFEARGFTRP